jgi:hypothetical protein
MNHEEKQAIILEAYKDCVRRACDNPILSNLSITIGSRKKNGISDFAAFRSFLLDIRGLLYLNEPIHYKKIIKLLRTLDLNINEIESLAIIENELEKTFYPFVIHSFDKIIPPFEQVEMIFYGEGIHLSSGLLKKVYASTAESRSHFYFNFTYDAKEKLSFLVYLSEIIEKYQKINSLAQISFPHYKLESHES